LGAKRKGVASAFYARQKNYKEKIPESKNALLMWGFTFHL
jgi:hypothetical protein